VLSASSALTLSLHGALSFPLLSPSPLPSSFLSVSLSSISSDWEEKDVFFLETAIEVLMGMRLSSLIRLTCEKGDKEEEREIPEEKGRDILPEEEQRKVAEKVADLYASLRIRGERDR
jgi:hypothetical protein